MLKFFLDRRRSRRVSKLVKQTRNNISYRLKVLFIRLIAVLILHALAMMWLEGLTVTDAAWLTLTTVTTVGYGDLSATTFWGQLSTVLLLYLLGIWMLAQLAGEYLDFRIERRERINKGYWRWNQVKDHIVIVNAPAQNTEQYLLRLVEQFRETPSLTDKPVILACDKFSEGLPKSLSDLGVVYKHANTSIGNFFSDVNINDASHVVFLAIDALDPGSDSLTLDLLDQYEQRNSKVNIVAEAVQDTNVKRFKKIGADSVLRPVRAYPEIIVRALSSPGTECIFEDLFNHFGASIHRYDITIDNKTWKNIACSLIQQEMGTPLGYINDQGEVKTCPPEGDLVKAKALLVMARDESIPNKAAIANCLVSA